MKIEEPSLSLDKISFLVNCPSLARENKKLSSTLKSRSEDLSTFLLDEKNVNHLDINNKKDLGSTDNYLHHFRLAGGIDLQFGVKRKLQKKIGEEEFYGPNIPKDMTVDEYFRLAKFEDSYDYIIRKKNIISGKDTEFGIRVEYNPNNVQNYNSLAWFFIDVFPILNPFYKQDLESNNLVKITRLDIAIDYPYPLNPLMFTSRANKMSFYSSKKNGVETVYFGTSRSKKQVRLYNKRVEMIEQGQGFCDNDNLWRFEMAFAESFFLDDKPVNDLFPTNSYKDMKVPINDKNKNQVPSVFMNPFKEFRYYDFNSIVEKHELTFEVHCLLHAAQFGLGFDIVIDEYCKKYDSAQSARTQRFRKMEKIKKFKDCYGKITPPEKVYKDQFYFEYEMLAGQIRGFFKS